jgi:hypothetical protein
VGESPAYRTGIHAGDTRIIFTDGGMSKQSATSYELLDLGQMKALASTRPSSH